MSFAQKGGISVEDPCLFTYGGRWYYFTAMISNPDVSVGAQNLDNKNLELFEYTNEINSLCLYGNIIYNDLDGSISRFFNRQDNHVEIVCRQMEKVSEGGTSEQPALEMFVDIERSDGANVFAHSFIVQNIKILHREKQNITYQISLISMAWYLLSSKISFSNYPLSEPASEKKPRNGYTMMKNFLTNAFLPKPDAFKVDDKSFDDAAKTTKEIEIPLITNGNDNCFSVIKDIFNKMYWNKETMDKTAKFIVFNPVTNIYKCVDYSVDNSWNSCEKPYIILSMFETDYEQELFSVNNQLASIAGKNATNTYEDLFDHKIWKYNSDLNDFEWNKTGLRQKDISNFYNNKPDNFKVINRLITKDKYPIELKPDWFPKELHYNCQMPEWNRSYSLYQSLIDNLTKRDALIVNTEGDITHQPGACMGIVLDRTIEKVPEMTPEQKLELYAKHRQIESLFPILKVQHRYHLANSPKAPASYTENVVLGRNFIMPPVTGRVAGSGR